jgi:hypothetical protein
MDTTGTGRIAAVLAILCAAQVVSGSGTARAAPTHRPSGHAAPSTITLTSSDVHSATGDNFTAGHAVVTNAQVAVIEKVSLATMNRYRLTGYYTFFARGATSGVKGIADSVGLYKSPSAAKWEYKLFTGENKPPKGSKTISLSGIGDEARGYTTGAVGEVYMQRGVYTARIDISGLGVSLSPIFVRLSRVLDGRMKTH